MQAFFRRSFALGWSYYGEKSVEYLFGKSGVRPYRYLWVFAVFLGSVATVPMVWDLADAMKALMAIPNLVSLFLLNGVIVAETRKYLWENRLDEYAPETATEAEMSEVLVATPLEVVPEHGT